MPLCQFRELADHAAQGDAADAAARTRPERITGKDAHIHKRQLGQLGP